MKIYSIPIFTKYINEKSEINRNEKTQQKTAAHSGYAYLSYPANYYVNFKSAPEKSAAHYGYLDYLDTFFEENENRPLKEVINDVDIFEPISYSRVLDYEVSKLIAYTIKNIKPEIIDKKFLKNIINAGLEAINSSENSDEVIQSMKNRYIIYHENNININYEYLEKEKLLSKIASVLNPAKIPGCEPGCNFDTQKRAFTKAANLYLKEHYKFSVLNEKVYNKIKDRINEFEPLKDYDKKMQAVKAEEIKNNNPSADRYAEEIYNDVIEKHIPPFENEKFYDYLSKNMEKLDLQLEKLYEDKFARIYTDAFNKSGIDEKHKILLVDPGVAFNIEKLAEFVNKNQIDTKKLKPIELRQKFSDYLGTETIYRGVQANDILPEELAEKIRHSGNYAPAFRNKDKAIRNIKYYLDLKQDVEDSHWDRIIAKIKRYDKQSEYLSVSSEYDIAASVPKDYDEEKSVVIEAQVPVLSLLKQKNEYENMQTSRMYDTLYVGDNRYDYEHDQERIEAFIPFYIPPKDMKVTIDTKTPIFRWLG